jgi:hypothetical protein
MARKNQRTLIPRVEEPESLHQTEGEAVEAGPANISDSEMEDAHQERTEAGVSIPEKTIMPPTSSSDSSSDADIRQSRQELRALKRQQARLELRLKINETRRKVSRLQSRVQGEEDEGDERGGKRPRANALQVSVHDSPRSQPRSRQTSGHEHEIADSAGSVNLPLRQRGPDQEPFMKAPPRLKLEPKYAGKSLREYTIFMARLDNHFERYARAYTDDRQKIADAVAELDDDMLRKWVQHKKDIDEDLLTWTGFCDFQLSLINDPVNLTREAMRRYMTATQKFDQSVRDFAAYLKEWEQLLEPYSEEQRKEHLRAKVLYEVRAESLKYSKEPESYDAYVAHLQTVEDSIPTRRAALKGKRPRGAGRIASHSESAARDERRTTRFEQPGRPDRKSSHTKFVCYYCNQQGHKSPSCPKRIQDEKSRREGADSKN